MHWCVGDQVTGAESFANASESVEYKGLAVSQTPGESSSNYREELSRRDRNKTVQLWILPKSPGDIFIQRSHFVRFSN